MAKKIFVLDTSVILFNHQSITSFQEHDIAIPITVLEELDNFKKGSETKNFEAREFIRFLDNCSQQYPINDWIPLPKEGAGKFKIILNSDIKKMDAIKVFAENTMDNKILNAALALHEAEKKREVILVTKDINLRLKAKALGLKAEDFKTGKVQNVANFEVGYNTVTVSKGLIDRLYLTGQIDKTDIIEFEPSNNQYYILEDSEGTTGLAYFDAQEQWLIKVNKHPAYGIKPKNVEQAFALHAISNPNVKLVAILGVAGSGKTLLALAGALEQRKDFKQIFLARPIVPLSNKDLGFLPGDIHSKIDPYMQPLWDNLKFIQNQFKENDKQFKLISQMLEDEKLIIAPLAYIRGRSLSDIIFIIDEAQNLTPHEVKTIVTRAGENAKFIFTGDIRQIDTPYLDEQSNGLSYMVDKLKGQTLFTHIRLQKGERSALANLANDLL